MKTVEYRHNNAYDTLLQIDAGKVTRYIDCGNIEYIGFLTVWEPTSEWEWKEPDEDQLAPNAWGELVATRKRCGNQDEIIIADENHWHNRMVYYLNIE